MARNDDNYFKLKVKDSKIYYWAYSGPNSKLVHSFILFKYHY